MKRQKKKNLLIKPIPQNSPSGSNPTDLHPFRAPPLLAVENRKRRPADLAFGGLAHGASFRISLSSKVSLLLVDTGNV